MSRIKIAIVGLGKIARDQHVPSLRASDEFDLVGIASPHTHLDEVPSFGDFDTLMRHVPDIHAIALCTTPQARYDIAREALQRGLHVLLEKPPGITVSEVQALTEIASRRSVSLFASWHSRHAPAVDPARGWIAAREIRRVAVTWKEDVRIWHPGQRWIWSAGGLGVFDPGINALSILTRIIPGVIVLKEAELHRPSNCATPIAAHLRLVASSGADIQIDLDFLQTGEQIWDILAEADDGRLKLSRGGNYMSVDDRLIETGRTAEYAGVYAHFAELVRARRSDVDLAPLQLVADAFLCGTVRVVAPFVD